MNAKQLAAASGAANHGVQSAKHLEVAIVGPYQGQTIQVVD